MPSPKTNRRALVRKPFIAESQRLELRLVTCRFHAPRAVFASIPSFDENGFSPVGVHDCTLNEIKVRFGSFQLSDRRPKLFEKFEAFVAELRSAGFARGLLVDGSFATATPDPNDIDLVLTLPFTHDLTADLSPVQYNLISKRRVQSRYGFDIVAVREGTVEFDEAVAFFTRVRHAPALRKGILRLLL